MLAVVSVDELAEKLVVVKVAWKEEMTVARSVAHLAASWETLTAAYSVVRSAEQMDASKAVYLAVY